MLEKPIGLNEKEAIQLATEAENAGITHMTAFTYRFAPAIRYIRKLISDGKLGEIRHFRSQRFLDWPETSWYWRQYKKTAGAGNIYDMMIHRIDFAQYLIGNIKSVSGKVKQFVPRYKTPNGEICPLSEVDDWSALIVDFENGATGVFEGSTLMKGHHNNGFGFEWAEVNGSAASVVYQLADPYNILFGTHGKTLEKLPVPKEFLVIEGSPRVPDQGKPSEVFRYDQMYEFVSAITEKRPAKPSFIDGAKAQVVADAALLSSQERREVDVQLRFSTNGNSRL
jgi:predicted dehydrogenase